VLYLLGAFAESAFSFLLTEGYSVGASTAVFGLVTAGVIFFYQDRKLFGSQAKQAIGKTVFIIAINSFIGLAGLAPGIDNWGNMGGLLGGNICLARRSALGSGGNLPGFHLQAQREFREIVLGTSVALLVFGALAAWG